jgi:hypothetical protein
MHMDVKGRQVTRRMALMGGAAAAGAMALPLALRARETRAAIDAPALVIVYLNGGPAGFFNSAQSFLGSGAFGVTHDNVKDVGGGLLVDAASLGSLPPASLGHMASINFKHGAYQHSLARAALLEEAGHNNLVRLAGAMPAASPLRCAVVNTQGLPNGVTCAPPAEGGARMTLVTDLGEIPAAGDVGEAAAAYGVEAGKTLVASPRSSLLAAELLVRGGTSLVFTQPIYEGRPDRQFDTHDDPKGALARQIMAPLTPLLRTFLQRLEAMPGRNVVVAILGEFSRTVPTGDHAQGGTATVIGRYVRSGTAGPQDADGQPPANTAPVAGLWSYLAGALRLREHPFGANPNPQLLV